MIYLKIKNSFIIENVGEIIVGEMIVSETVISKVTLPAK
jgi:hypothetical protein